MFTFADMIAQLRQSYDQWEQRHRARFNRWPVGRRWLVFVLTPTLLVCCGGTVIGAPLAWFARATIDAGRGAKTPDAVADEYLLALSYANQDGLLPLLDEQHRSQLLQQWRSYLSEMRSTDPPPSRLDYGALTVGPVADNHATVTVPVAATWWSSSSGLAGGYTSKQLRWRFETRNSDGWRVSTIAAPAWCGGYVLASKCQTR